MEAASYIDTTDTYTKFQDIYAELKTKQDWHGIIKAGNSFLSTSDIPKEEQAKVHLILASDYFYVNQYKEALRSGEAALNLAKGLDAPDLRGRSLYLCSAALRAIAREHEKEGGFEAADIAASKAESFIQLAISSSASFAPSVQGKVFFNAGALYHDVACKKNISEAQGYYSQAEGIFSRLGQTDDLHRVQLRSIRSLMELNQLKEARHKINDLSIDPDSKTGIQFQLLKCKLLMQENKPHAAIAQVEIYIPKAKEKSMGFEVKEFEDIKAQVISLIGEVPAGSHVAMLGATEETELGV